MTTTAEAEVEAEAEILQVGRALKFLKSEGVTVNVVVIQYSTGETYTDSSKKPLTNDYVMDIKGGEPMQVAVSATGVNDNSTLTIQLLQNGQVKRTSSSKGIALSASFLFINQTKKSPL